MKYSSTKGQQMSIKPTKVRDFVSLFLIPVTSVSVVFN